MRVEILRMEMKLRKAIGCVVPVSMVLITSLSFQESNYLPRPTNRISYAVKLLPEYSFVAIYLQKIQI